MFFIHLFKNIAKQLISAFVYLYTLKNNNGLKYSTK